jgi:hypothetical protein
VSREGIQWQPHSRARRPLPLLALCAGPALPLPGPLRSLARSSLHPCPLTRASPAPLPSSAATRCSPAAFPFFYIEPPRFKNIIDRFNPKGVPITQFDAIGAKGTGGG